MAAMVERSVVGPFACSDLGSCVHCKERGRAPKGAIANVELNKKPQKITNEVFPALNYLSRLNTEFKLNQNFDERRSQGMEQVTAWSGGPNSKMWRFFNGEFTSNIAIL